MDVTRLGWRRVALICVAVAVLAALTSISMPSEMSGRWQTYSLVRKSLAKTLSSGTVDAYRGTKVNCCDPGYATLVGPPA